jgi:hypothetical protein
MTSTIPNFFLGTRREMRRLSEAELISKSCLSMEDWDTTSTDAFKKDSNDEGFCCKGGRRTAAPVRHASVSWFKFYINFPVCNDHDHFMIG